MVWQDRLDELRTHRAGARRRRAGPHRPPARPRPVHHPRAPRPHPRPRLLPRGGRPRRRGGVRGREPHRVHARAVRHGPRQDRRAARRHRRRGLHDPRRLRQAVQAARQGRRHRRLPRGCGPRVPDPARPADRGRRRQRPEHRLRWGAAALRRQLPVPARRRGDDVRPCRRRRARLRRGRAGRTLAARALERDDEGDLGGLRGRAARRAAHDGPGAHPVRARRRAHPRPRVRLHRQRGGRRGGRVPPGAAVPLLHALQHLRTAPRRRVQRRAARPRAARRHRAARPASPLLDAQGAALDARRGLDLRDQAALRAEPDHGVRAHQRAPRRSDRE